MAAAALLAATVATLERASAQEVEVEAAVERWASIYAQREDFDGFLALYDDDMQLFDYIAGAEVDGIEAFRGFFAWEYAGFEKVDSVALVVERVLVDDRRAVVSGHFPRFRWEGEVHGPMHFTTILTFGEDGRIVRHEDWINYPNALLDYASRADSNLWIGGSGG